MADGYGQFFRRVLNPAWETGLRRRPTLRHLRYLEETQWRSLDELNAIQAGELRRLLRHAYANVPYYRALFDKVGARPDDLRDAGALARLPVLQRDRARDTIQERTATAGAAVEIRKSTSGTMGRPLVFGYEASSEYWRQACKLRGYGWAGYKPGMRSLHFWGGGPPPVAGATTSLKKRLTKLKVQADRAIRREHYIDCGRRGSVELDGVIEAIKRDQPEVIVCYSQAGADLARHVLQRNARSWGTIPVLCGAERLLPADRAVLEQAFGDAVFETYGCREVMLISTECDAHDGQHVSMETLVVEVVVRDGNGVSRPAQPGELGEVVVTDLTNLAMPFIRYANGDLAVAGKPGTCRCGRALPRLASVEGRVTETLVDGSGARVNGLVFNVVIAHLAHAIQQFQVVQRKDRSVTLRVVPTATFDSGIEGVLRATWERYLAGVPVTLELVGDLPISQSGKRQVVVVERD
jgi:phenylacetate-CoA ligase